MGAVGQGVVEEVPRVRGGLGRMRFVRPVRQVTGCVHLSVAEGRASRKIATASCRSGMGRSHRRPVVCSVAQKVEEGALIAKELAVLQPAGAGAEARGGRHRAAAVVALMALRRVEEVGEEQAVRPPGPAALERVTLMAVEEPCPRAFERKGVALVASCQSEEAVLACRLYSRPESPQA